MTDSSGHNPRLTYWICGAIVAAIALALLAPHVAESLEVGGELFLRLLKMIVVPLVFTSVLSGVLGLGDVRKLGKPGLAAIGYYLCTTVIAVIASGTSITDSARLVAVTTISSSSRSWASSAPGAMLATMASDTACPSTLFWGLSPPFRSADSVE